MNVTNLQGIMINKDGRAAPVSYVQNVEGWIVDAEWIRSVPDHELMGCVFRNLEHAQTREIVTVFMRNLRRPWPHEDPFAGEVDLDSLSGRIVLEDVSGDEMQLVSHVLVELQMPSRFIPGAGITHRSIALFSGADGFSLDGGKSWEAPASMNAVRVVSGALLKSGADDREHER